MERVDGPAADSRIDRPDLLRRGTAPDRGAGALAQRRLLDPLGIDDTRWPRDAAGQATIYSGLQSTCHDLARVGHLVLNDGAWGDKQVVPAGAVEQLAQPSSRHSTKEGSADGFCPFVVVR